jgi:hypothetical protein
MLAINPPAQFALRRRKGLGEEGVEQAAAGVGGGGEASSSTLATMRRCSARGGTGMRAPAIRFRASLGCAICFVFSRK